MKQEIVGSAFIEKDSKVLVVRRADTKRFLPGLWEVPGGHVEYGESLEVGIAREVVEELHVDLEIGRPFYTFTYNDGDSHVIEVDCFAHLKDESQPIVLNEEDHSEMRWITAAEIPAFFSPEDWTGKALVAGFEILENTKG